MPQRHGGRVLAVVRHLIPDFTSRDSADQDGVLVHVGRAALAFGASFYLALLAAKHISTVDDFQIKESIMPWQIDTMFQKIGKGIIFSMTFAPHVAGYKPPPLRVGDQVTTQFADNSRTSATIIQISDDEMVLEMPDGTRWLATPRTDSDPPIPNLRTGPSPSQDWVVREEV